MHASPHNEREIRAAAVIVGIVGIWGALVPFVGPLFGYGMGTSPAWQWSESHLTLHLAPGVAAVVGAALMLRGRRTRQLPGAALAVLGGAWFVIAPTLHPLWAAASGMGGMGGSTWSGVLSGLGYHYGTGAVITVAAAYALGALGTTSTSSDGALENGPSQSVSGPTARERTHA